MTYVLPLRRWRVEDDEELAGYLVWLSSQAHTIVVDGSAESIFAAHREAFGSVVTHIPVDGDLTGRYGKVNGVITGLRAATGEKVVIADDDVRYDTAGLERMARLLDTADLVRPQNYFAPLPWHARWDTARTLLNRAFGADYPGTFGLRRTPLLAVGGYDGDCLFENLELIRTVEVSGGRVVNPLDFYVRRLPPPARQFWSQRVRQAYDDFAQPGRLAAELALLPAAALLSFQRRPKPLALAAAMTMALAETGRRRAGGAVIFPPTCSLFAPLWVGERSICIWMALWNRVRRGGVPYAGTVLSKAANSKRAIQRHHERLSGNTPGSVPVRSSLAAYVSSPTATPRTWDRWPAT